MKTESASQSKRDEPLMILLNRPRGTKRGRCVHDCNLARQIQHSSATNQLSAADKLSCPALRLIVLQLFNTTSRISPDIPVHNPSFDQGQPRSQRTNHFCYGSQQGAYRHHRHGVSILGGHRQPFETVARVRRGEERLE
jgi:hypothetical protein